MEPDIHIDSRRPVEHTLMYTKKTESESAVKSLSYKYNSARVFAYMHRLISVYTVVWEQGKT